MGNKLFQLADESVRLAENSVNLVDVDAKIQTAQNQVSSAFANSTIAEKEQLNDLQQRLDRIQK